MDGKSIICFLTVNPGKLFYHFVKQISNPERIYICIDDNNHEIPGYDGEIKIIKINGEECVKNGFQNTHSKIRGATSREKALYYFCTVDIDFNHIWFIEDDVFIPTATTIDYLDNKYPHGDLLCASNSVVNTQSEVEKSGWDMWDNYSVKTRYPLPWVCSMICAIRCSKKLLDCIQDYANKYGELFMCEILFNTTALHNNLTILPIEELSGITWRNKIRVLDDNYLYHPVKSISEQYKLRISGIKDPKVLNWIMILCIICGISLVTVSLILYISN
ncbi:MAG: hypothetical protein ACW99E_23735 [Promethearchaeota archaeon]|jgi:hypothetical protein